MNRFGKRNLPTNDQLEEEEDPLYDDDDDDGGIAHILDGLSCEDMYTTIRSLDEDLSGTSFVGSGASSNAPQHEQATLPCTQLGRPQCMSMC
ncbi:hypothetical protein OROMI_013699 [Orobanche minor]